jgi:ribosomal protein L11 methyltransferase
MAQFIARVVYPENKADELVAIAYDFLTLGILEKPAAKVGFEVGDCYFQHCSEAEAFLSFIGEQQFYGELIVAADPDWTSYQQSWSPQQIGARWFLVPQNCTEPTPENHLRLTMPPGKGFGAGDHPTTRLILAAMETHVNSHTRFADVGCGVGLLCKAAELLHATSVFGCDIDADAIAVARGVVDAQTVIQLGSVEILGLQQFDVAVLNQTLGQMRALLASVAANLSENGRLLLSGILASQLADLEDLVRDADLEMQVVTSESDWLLAVAHHRGNGSIKARTFAPSERNPLA